MMSWKGKGRCMCNVTANVAVLNATMDQSNGDVESCSKGVKCSEMFQNCFCD